jgi:hypothetical protein
MSNMHRKLRMAFSVLCGIFCLLLIMVWMRSDWTLCGVSGNRGQHYIYCDIHSARFMLSRILPSSQFPPEPWRRFSRPISKSDLEADANSSRGSFCALGFQWRVVGNGWRVAVPLWFPTAVCAGLGVAPWLRWRFSLLSIFIATAVIAGVLAIAMARDWVNTEPQNTIPRVPPQQSPANAPRFTPVGWPAWKGCSSMATHPAD